MAIVGIDPGKDGGVVVIDGPSFAPTLHLYVMPMLGKGRREYDLQRMCAILKSHTPEFVAVERQQSMKSFGKSKRKFDGSKQSFSTGVGYALWLGALAMATIPFETVAPRTWQTVMLKDVIGPDTKTKAKIVAQRLQPSVDWRATPRCKVIHEGLADAFCIAEWARRRLHRGEVAGL